MTAPTEKMRVEEIYVPGRRTGVRRNEQGGKHHKMPCHHKLDEYLQEYIEAAGVSEDRKG